MLKNNFEKTSENKPQNAFENRRTNVEPKNATKKNINLVFAASLALLINSCSAPTPQLSNREMLDRLANIELERHKIYVDTEKATGSGMANYSLFGQTPYMKKSQEGKDILDKITDPKTINTVLSFHDCIPCVQSYLQHHDQIDDRRALNEPVFKRLHGKINRLEIINTTIKEYENHINEKNKEFNKIKAQYIPVGPTLPGFEWWRKSFAPTVTTEQIFRPLINELVKERNQIFARLNPAEQRYLAKYKSGYFTNRIGTNSYESGPKYSNQIYPDYLHKK